MPYFVREAEIVRETLHTLGFTKIENESTRAELAAYAGNVRPVLMSSYRESWQP
jgi:hypothetical protein